MRHIDFFVLLSQYTYSVTHFKRHDISRTCFKLTRFVVFNIFGFNRYKHLHNINACIKEHLCVVIYQDQSYLTLFLFLAFLCNVDKKWNGSKKNDVFYFIVAFCPSFIINGLVHCIQYFNGIFFVLFNEVSTAGYHRPLNCNNCMPILQYRNNPNTSTIYLINPHQFIRSFRKKSSIE